ncbi:hypothetical protein [Streptomyces sp. NPDC093225]|uniref:hypothetical protein n=1 Tax=Streptomyces sp. NPDC093225 TaxID=3366034 RepID=UPI00381E5666
MARSRIGHLLLRAVATAGLLVGLAAGGAAADDDVPELPTLQQPVVEGTFGFTGEAGDEVTQGLSENWDGAEDQSFIVQRSSHSNMLLVEAKAPDGTWWGVDLGAPGGRKLTAGTYTDVAQFPFHGDRPGLDFSGAGRWCSQGALTGSFTVTAVDWTEEGWLNSVDARFEQRCKGSTGASRGYFHIRSTPAPPVLKLSVSGARTGGVTPGGRAVLHGTVRCTKTSSVNVAAHLEQQQGAATVTGWLVESVDCTAGRSVPWEGEVRPYGGARFLDGWADATVDARADDWDYALEVHVQKAPRVCLGACGS